jgi:hypothetical protein
MRINYYFAALAFILTGLAGCAASQLQLNSQFDASEKTITMPPGGALLLAPLKRDLKNAGWQITVESGPERTVGTLGEKTDLATGRTFLTRYRLMINQRQVDVCAGTGLPTVSYDLSVIDNQSGEEIMTQTGKDCTDLVEQWFASAISCKAGASYCASSTARFCSRTAICPAQ